MILVVRFVWRLREAEAEAAAEDQQGEDEELIYCRAKHSHT